MNFKIIIPARFNSSRFLGKPLALINGKEMILRVAQICINLAGKKNVVVATDSKKIKTVLDKNNLFSVMTPKKCQTGTDRVAYAIKKIKGNTFLNVQGDEPLIKKSDIVKVLKEKKHNPNHVICGYSYLKKENLKNKNIIKVAFNKKKELVYFSRAPIPALKNKKRNKDLQKYFKQVCIYAFNRNQLNKFYNSKRSNLEINEDIELLRFKDLDIKIKMVELNASSLSVDVPSDIKKVEKQMRMKN
tara:strand:+ start:321 stop:1055 length:735 start_codon:yes stop_codon:yes gene_type:complete